MSELQIACLDVAYSDQIAVAACVLFRGWTASAPMSVQTAAVRNPSDYLSGQLYRRELPALLAVLGGLDRLPDLAIVDGYVWLDRAADRPGLGARLHTALAGSTPVIGVAKTRFAGDDWSIAVLRSTSRRPLFVTAVGLDQQEAADAVAAMHGDYRIPAMLQLADTAARRAAEAL